MPVHWEEETIQEFTGHWLVAYLNPQDLKCHYDLPIRMVAYGSQVINIVCAWVCLMMTHKLILLLILQFFYGHI